MATQYLLFGVRWEISNKIMSEIREGKMKNEVEVKGWEFRVLSTIEFCCVVIRIFIFNARLSGKCKPKKSKDIKHLEEALVWSR